MSDEHPAAVYTPFPSFVDWLETDFDTTEFDRYGSLFSQTKAEATPEQLSETLTTAMRYAAVDTNAIEGIYETDRGFTRTVATQAAAWEAVMESRGTHVRLAFDDALSGYEYVLDATTRSTVVNEVWIRELHQILCRSQDTYKVYTEHGPQERPLEKGRYKTLPNSPSLADGRIHAYAPVLDTPAEMGRFIDEIRSEGFLAAHPVVQAAYAHYAYVCIHPFADGNGRVARALASTYLYRVPGVPLIVFVDQRNDYYDALEAADAGQPANFVQFIGARALDAVGIMRVMLQRSAPAIGTTLTNLNAIFSVGQQNEELRAAALRLKNMTYRELKRQFDAVQLPHQLDGHVNSSKVGNVTPPPGYGSIGDVGGFYMVLKSSWPIAVRVLTSLAVMVREESEAPSDLIILTSTGQSLEVALGELVPTETEALKIRINSWTEDVLAVLFAEVERLARGGAKNP